MLISPKPSGISDKTKLGGEPWSSFKEKHKFQKPDRLNPIQLKLYDRL